jgi:N-dimethylarginine dimethylaminohydrolase
MSEIVDPNDGWTSVEPGAVRPADHPRRTSHEEVVLTWPVHIEATGVADEDDDWVETDLSDAERRRGYDSWQRLRTAYDGVATVRSMNPLSVYDAARDRADGDLPPPWERPDVVFTANVCLPYPDERRVLLSKMAPASRAGEPAYVGAWLADRGYEVEELDADGPFEGTGDAIWHPGRRLLWGGVGPRTDREVYAEIARRTDATVVPLSPRPDWAARAGVEAAGDSFFHLDTCFCPLDESSVLLVRELFDEVDLAAVEAAFDTVVDCPLAEARPSAGYACNAHCPDGETVLVQAGNPTTVERLEANGFAVRQVETDPFHSKCGGSVCCLKLALP